VLIHPHYRLNVLAVIPAKAFSPAGEAWPHTRRLCTRSAHNTTGSQNTCDIFWFIWFCSKHELAAIYGRFRQKWWPTLFSLSGAGVLNMRAFFASSDLIHSKAKICRLTEKNFRDALIASGSIPLVLEGVVGIDGI
jgi:hypothetical protein